MKLLTLLDKKVVQDFLELSANKSGAEFLASLEWAEILHSEKEEVETLGVYSDDNKLWAVLNLITSPLKYYYLPRGPIFAPDLSPENKKIVWQFLSDYLKNKKAIFWRVEPIENPLIISKKTYDLQPQETLILDLELTEAELLLSFHPKTRYNIKLAEKKGVTVREGIGLDDFEKFWTLMGETGKRDAFKIHNKKHYQTLSSANPNFIKLFLAEVAGKVIAAGLFSFYGDKVTYLHGASAYSSRQFMAPYLLQWILIKMSKNKNYKYYDFYGINEKKWPGVTRFKLGFSGYRVVYAGTYDIVLNTTQYFLYNLLRRVKRFL